jgi:DNA-binding response OmpR family regulator
MATVLLVEDNPKLNEINRRALEKAGCAVLTALTLHEARAYMAQNAPDVILLDVMLPDGDGINFCGEIRDATDAHILFLTSKTEYENRVRGLETGGDDYITKPYKLEEMLARVNAALRRLPRRLPSGR